MKPEARFRVSCQPGQISQTKPMVGGWEAFEMTADINHGDSGGPVFDKHGRVIGINVAVSEIPGHTLAVPIDVAKEFLVKAGVQLGSRSDDINFAWENGLRLFAQHRYDEARKEFLRISIRREGLLSEDPAAAVLFPTVPRPGRLGPRLTTPPGNQDPYVEDMIRRCSAQLAGERKEAI